MVGAPLAQNVERPRTIKIEEMGPLAWPCMALYIHMYIRKFAASAELAQAHMYPTYCGPPEVSWHGTGVDDCR